MKQNASHLSKQYIAQQSDLLDCYKMHTVAILAIYAQKKIRKIH